MIRHHKPVKRYFTTIRHIQTVAAARKNAQIGNRNIAGIENAYSMPPFSRKVAGGILIIGFVHLQNRSAFTANGYVDYILESKKRIIASEKTAASGFYHHAVLKHDLLTGAHENRVDNPRRILLVDYDALRLGVNRRLKAFCSVGRIKSKRRSLYHIRHRSCRCVHHRQTDERHKF